MKYSVVMPVYLREESHRDVVVDTLENIKANMPDDSELIIIDDGSTLPTGFLREYADVYVRQPNSGISRGWNVGMMLSRGEYVAIVNDDIKVPGGWLDTLSQNFDALDCGVSGVGFGGPSRKPELLAGDCWVDHKWFPGYCFMLKRDRFYELFDEQFRTNCGDCDFWHRVRNAGLSLHKAPISIWHKEGGVLHGMDYDKISKSSIELFEKKWGFNPQQEYYG